MNDRIRKLRQASLDAEPTISLERAQLLTDFYKSGEATGQSVPVTRALAFRYLLEHKTTWIGDGELIVGERGPVPKATPTYPEICTHTVDDFDILHNREKVFFHVDDEGRRIQTDEIIPFWGGKSIRDLIMARMDQSWIDAFEAGVYTEFMEQRAPGHTVADDKIYRLGMQDFIEQIDASLASLDFENDPHALDKREQLTAMRISAGALIRFARRYADHLDSLVATEADPVRKTELEEMVWNCRRVPANAPKTFHEALQYYWFVHLGVITELNTWDSFNPGRLDRHLQPFYEAEIAAGTLTEERARELLQAFWIKFNNQPAPPKVGVTAQESNTYTDFCLINLGGVDEHGVDAVNEMTYLILDVIEEMRLLQPSSMVQISKVNPDNYLHRALKIVKTGFGQPSIFNTDAIIQEQLRQGKSLVDARNGGASGCVETGAFGKESYILTGYFNLVKVLEVTLNNGTDPRSGKVIGLRTGDPRDFTSFDEVYAAFEKQLRHFVDIKLKGNRIIERLYATVLPAPFLSILVEDCIATGVDYNAGGARYNSSYVQVVGMGSITDSLSAIKHQVYDEHFVSMDTLLNAVSTNFADHDDLRTSLLNDIPRYGNDNDLADSLTLRVFESIFGMVDERPNTKGGHFRINLLPTTSHVYFGSVIGAMPDGRLAGKPLSEGISPVQGTDLNGPTAVIKSAAKLDHIRTGGTLLNQKFSPQVLDSEDGIRKVGQLVRTYFRMDGHHIQFNVIDAELLREAQVHPEEHRDLIVRVAGYSDYFVDLGEELQNEIIERTEHAGM
jgi:trans-4-hydroxy-L-proline dehydratase